MKKTRLALLCPILDDPTSHYRGLGPWDKLCREQDFQLTFPTQLSWASLIGVDILILQRPATPEHFGMLCLAKNMGVKVIVDFDDDNLSVPRDNPTYPQYCQMPVKEAILNLARHADVLIVTTDFLKNKYGIYNKNTVIIPNALDDQLVKRRPVLPGDRENKFVWRGNLSQVKNLSTVSQNVLAVSKRHPHFKFVFFGFEPFDLTEAMGASSEVIPPMSLMEYFSALCHVHGKLLYYPLHYQDHSQSRSHISWLEATYANMGVLAYRNSEFIRPGCLNYSSLTEFEDTMNAVALGQVDLSHNIEESWNAIQEKYLLSKVNQRRLEIVQSLL